MIDIENFILKLILSRALDIRLNFKKENPVK